MQIERQVCRIEIPTPTGMIFGTGFLIGPNLIMTNYHVIEPLLALPDATTEAYRQHSRLVDVTLRFDYRRLSDGQVVSAGVEYHLDVNNWLLDSSPPARHSWPPTLAELDYAILRCDHAPGLQTVTGTSEPISPVRGWIRVPDEPYDFRPDTPLLIVQHPKGAPLQLAIDTSAIISVNADRALVIYRTNTQPGSSGSPCFDANWQLVALHHSGDPDYSTPKYNAGTPIDTIRASLVRSGVEISKPPDA